MERCFPIAARGIHGHPRPQQLLSHCHVAVPRSFVQGQVSLLVGRCGLCTLTHELLHRLKLPSPRSQVKSRLAISTFLVSRSPLGQEQLSNASVCNLAHVRSKVQRSVPAPIFGPQSSLGIKKQLRHSRTTFIGGDVECRVQASQVLAVEAAPLLCQRGLG